MTCEECLATLGTDSLREMSPDSPVVMHCATCPECARVTTTLREREYEAATLLNSLLPMNNPLAVAEEAIRISRRRRFGPVAVLASGAALVVTIWIAAATTVIPALNHNDARIASALRTETIQLKCLSPQQAGDIINPYVRSGGCAYFIPSSGISAITVRATLRELETSRNLIREFEQDPGAACRNPMGLPGQPGPTGPVPEKITTQPKK